MRSENVTAIIVQQNQLPLRASNRNYPVCQAAPGLQTAWVKWIASRVSACDDGRRPTVPPRPLGPVRGFRRLCAVRGVRPAVLGHVRDRFEQLASEGNRRQGVALLRHLRLDLDFGHHGLSPLRLCTRQCLQGLVRPALPRLPWAISGRWLGMGDRLVRNRRGVQPQALVATRPSCSPLMQLAALEGRGTSTISGAVGSQSRAPDPVLPRTLVGVCLLLLVAGQIFGTLLAIASGSAAAPGCAGGCVDEVPQPLIFACSRASKAISCCNAFSRGVICANVDMLGRGPTGLGLEGALGKAWQAGQGCWPPLLCVSCVKHAWNDGPMSALTCACARAGFPS